MPRGVYQRKPKSAGAPAESRPKTPTKKPVKQHQPKQLLQDHSPRQIIAVDDIQKKLSVLQGQFQILVSARAGLAPTSALSARVEQSVNILLDGMDELIDKLLPPRPTAESYKLVEDRTVPDNGAEAKPLIPAMPISTPVPAAPPVIPEVPR